MISILTISTLYPNPIQSAHGAFVATRLRYLRASGLISGEVVAPVPWLPPLVSHPSVGRLQSVPYVREDGDLRIHHPRYLVIPKVGMNLTPFTLYLCLKRSLSKLLAQGRRIDIIDAHYFYPDGVAALRLAREFGIPICITARGTDLNLIPQFDFPRRMIVNAAMRADGVVTVCQALKNRLIELAPAVKDVRVLRNGVDLQKFTPKDRIGARFSLGLTRRTLGSVGLLIERKGHRLVIEALKYLPNTDLVIVGEGPQRSALERLAKSEGVSDRVRFLGLIDQIKLAEIYSAIDALVLASSREGWANVLLEAMACGTPVVASAVWGTPEVVASASAGVLMTSLDVRGVVSGVNKLFADYPERSDTRLYAEQFSWDLTTRGQLELFDRILARNQPNKVA